MPPAPEKSVWLASEGLKLKKKGEDLDTAGKTKEAAFNYKLAAAKLEEAAKLIPEGNVDGPALSEHAQELSFRAVYLESLQGAPSSLPLEDHVGDLELAMDLSTAQEPAEEQVSALISKAVSGATAALDDSGYTLVGALESTAEMRVFVDRFLAKEGRRRVQGAGSDAQQDQALQKVETYAGMKDAIRRSGWVELDVDPKMDKLDMAMKYEREGHTVEDQGRIEEATDLYNRGLAVLCYVHKHDPRTKNPKIKDMVGKRVQELTAKVQSLGGEPNVF